MKVDIPKPIFDYCSYFYKNLVPKARQSGFTECRGQGRGEGDFYDLIGAMVVLDILARNDKVCGMDICCGKGDTKDLMVQVNETETRWNIKTSKYRPFRSGLNLFVKEEEVEKDIHGYIQVFIHIDEDEPPHVHIAGLCRRGNPLWNESVAHLRPIPGTGGHRGLHITRGEANLF